MSDQGETVQKAIEVMLSGDPVGELVRLMRRAQFCPGCGQPIDELGVHGDSCTLTRTLTQPLDQVLEQAEAIITEMKRAHLHLEMSEQAMKMIEKLHTTGLYGLTLEETAARLIDESLLRLFGPASLKVPLPEGFGQ